MKDPLNLLLIVSIFSIIFLLLPSRLWIQKSTKVYILYIALNVSGWLSHFIWLHWSGAHHSPSVLRWFYVVALVTFVTVAKAAEYLRSMVPWLAPVLSFVVVVVLFVYTEVSNLIGQAIVLVVLAAIGCLFWFILGTIQHETSIPQKASILFDVLLVSVLGAIGLRYVYEFWNRELYRKGICCVIDSLQHDGGTATDEELDSTWMVRMHGDCPLQFELSMQVFVVYIISFRILIELIDKYNQSRTQTTHTVEGRGRIRNVRVEVPMRTFIRHTPYDAAVAAVEEGEEEALPLFSQTMPSVDSSQEMRSEDF